MQLNFKTHNELKKLEGREASITGWAQTIRDQGGIKFILIRNKSGLFQCVFFKKSDCFEEASKVTHESVITVTGKVVINKQAPSGVELAADQLEILSLADPLLPIPISSTEHNEAESQKRLDWRWLDLRRPEHKLIFEVWTCMEQAGRNYWNENGFIEIHSPKLMSIPSEGAAELFEVNYFDQKAYLAQSPQVYKQMAMASGFDKVFEVGPIFRANPSFTSRHDTEFTGYDMEISYISSHEDVMEEEERWIVAMLKKIKEDYGDKIQDAHGAEIKVPTTPFPRITMKEAKNLLAPFKLKTEREDDLSPEEERKLSELLYEKNGHEFVFVTEYPIDVRPFYHMRHENNPQLTKSFDLLWKGIEITTGAQREHRYDKLIEQAKEKGLALEPLEFYFNFFKYGCPPHGGLGLSPTRMLMKIFDIANVREVTYIYRGPHRLKP